jgi:hypothetical protein
MMGGLELCRLLMDFLIKMLKNIHTYRSAMAMANLIRLEAQKC